MNVVERIFEYRIWLQIDMANMQFGFMKGREPLMPFLLYNRCWRIIELKESSSILALWI